MKFFLFISTAIALAACPKSPPPAVSPAPPPEPAPAPPPPEEPAEPETEPVVKEEPKHLDIQKNVIRLKRGTRIQFKTNSAEIEEASFTILDEVASVMQQNERIKIRVEGHTDNVGDAAYNKDLSAKRSAAVRTYLVGKGIAEERLESHGCGPDHPIADNATDDGKAENRRVEFVIIRKRRKTEPCQKYQPRRRGRGTKDGETAPAPTPDPAPAPTP